MIEGNNEIKKAFNLPQAQKDLPQVINNSSQFFNQGFSLKNKNSLNPLNHTVQAPLTERINSLEINVDSKGSQFKRKPNVRFERRSTLVDEKIAPTVFEMIKSGMKNQFILTNPEYGLKGYNVPDPLLCHDSYKIKNLPKISQSRFKNGFTYNMIKAHGETPCCMDLPMLAPWTKDKYYQHSGSYNKNKFMLEKKTLMTEQVMDKAKKDNYPSAKYNSVTDFKNHQFPYKCDQQEKSLAFYDEATWLGKQSPGAKYNGDYSVLKQKTYMHKIIPPTEMEE